MINHTLRQAFDPEFEFKGLNGNTFVLTPERREQMSQEQVLEMASFVLQKLKTVVQHFDGTISYRYIRLGKVR